MMARIMTCVRANDVLQNLLVFRCRNPNISNFRSYFIFTQKNSNCNEHWFNQHSLLLACDIEKQSYKMVHGSEVDSDKQPHKEIRNRLRSEIKGRLEKKRENIYDIKHIEKETKLINLVRQGAPAKDKETFMKAIDLFLEKEGNRRRGAVAFVNGALKEMKDFNVHRDLSAYKKLLSVFKEGKFVAKTFWEVEMMYAPMHQVAAMTLLDYAERHGVMPDEELGRMIIAIFGKRSHVARKYYRAMYWLPKFLNSNPYALPETPPKHLSDVAMLVLQRMCVDPQTRFSEYQVLEESEVDPTYIFSAQSPKQQKLLENHCAEAPLVVEGGFYTWGYGMSFLYFMLRSHVTDTFKHFQTHEEQQDEMDFDLTQMFGERQSQSALAIAPTEHELADGTVVAMAMTGSSSKASLMAWIKELEVDNPRLGEIPVYFHMRTPEAGFAVGDGDEELTKEQVESLYGELAVNHRDKRQREQKRREEEEQTISQHAT